MDFLLLLPCSWAFCMFAVASFQTNTHPLASGTKNFELAATFWSRVDSPFSFLPCLVAVAACDIIWLLMKSIDCRNVLIVLLLLFLMLLRPRRGKRSKVSTRKIWHTKWSPDFMMKLFKCAPKQLQQPLPQAIKNACNAPWGRCYTFCSLSPQPHSPPVALHSLANCLAQFCVHD